MLDSHQYSLKRRFQSALNVLGADPVSKDGLSQLVDSVISGDRDSINKNSSTEARAIILGLYYHHNLTSLNSYFSQPEYLTIALVIALTCRGERHRSFISKISSYLKPYPDFSSQLDLADNLANQGSSRAITVSLLAKDSLAFGIFCVLSTPYSWKLINQGAGDFQVSISAIAAAYLGYVTYTADNNLGNELGDRLLAAWSGVYDLSNIPHNFYPSVRFSQSISLGV